MPSNKILLLLYLLLSLLNIIAGSIENSTLVFISKPLLMPALGLWFYRQTKNHPPVFRNLILWAIFFSWGGDTLLMLVPSRGEQFFLLGLISFLIAHILYTTAFLKNVNLSNGFLKKNLWALLPFLLIYGSANYLLIPNVPEAMKIPVLIYGAVILFMATAALNRKDIIPIPTFQFVFWGALTFVLSDLILAFNKFNSPIDYSSFWIMSTYLLGQFWIAKGWSLLTPLKPAEVIEKEKQT